MYICVCIYICIYVCVYIYEGLIFLKEADLSIYLKDLV